jgi:acyl transferase domain-containing protein
MARAGLHFPRKPRPWPNAIAFAAINCFGDGGTNAHVILGPAPQGYVSTRTPLALPTLNRRIVLRGPVEKPAPVSQPFWEAYKASPENTPTALFWESYAIQSSPQTNNGDETDWQPSGRSDEVEVAL